MKLRILILLCSMSFALMASAQASGGQIRRPVKKQSTTTHNRPTQSSKPRKNEEQSQPQSEQAKPNISPAIQPIPMSGLATYNVVTNTFSILENAQGACQKLRNEGWGAQIYLDSSNMYRVLMVGTNQEPEAVLYRNHARQTYPNAWILKIDNGREFKYE